MTGVWIVILNFNDAQSTASCISSLRRHLTLPELKVVVVDNGSDTSRVSAVEQGYPPVTLVWTGKNLGFAGGVNFALKRILAHGPKYVMLLNNDVIVTEDFLSPLLHYMNDNPRVAVVGPIVVDLESGTIQSAGLWLSRFLLQTRNPFFHADRNMISSNREPMAVDYVSGCAMLVRGSVFSEVGLFDERFFLYEEEVDLCLRAKDSGYRIAVLPVWGVLHRGSVTANRRPTQKEYHVGRSHVLLLRKRCSPPTAALAAYAFIVKETAIRFAQTLLAKRDVRQVVSFVHGAASGLLRA